MSNSYHKSRSQEKKSSAKGISAENAEQIKNTPCTFSDSGLFDVMNHNTEPVSPNEHPNHYNQTNKATAYQVRITLLFQRYHHVSKMANYIWKWQMNSELL